MRPQWVNFQIFKMEISRDICQMFIFDVLKSLNKIYFIYYIENKLEKMCFSLELETHVNPLKLLRCFQINILQIRLSNS